MSLALCPLDHLGSGCRQDDAPGKPSLPTARIRTCASCRNYNQSAQSLQGISRHVHIPFEGLVARKSRRQTQRCVQPEQAYSLAHQYTESRFHLYTI